MIIQLLGANGAGKSTVVQELMSGLKCTPLYLFGRNRPDGYELYDVLIAGHYEGKACGGGDTLPRNLVVDCLKRLESFGKPVLLEGPTGREPMIAGEVRVVYLRRTYEQCMSGWEARQRAKGLSFNRATMGRRVTATMNRCAKMLDAYHEMGVHTLTIDNSGIALSEIERWLGRR